MAPLRQLAFRVWWNLTRSHTLGVRVLATDGDGRVLLVRHTYRPGWFLPGGGVERGEAPADAAAKELREEAGLIVRTPPALISVHTNFSLLASDYVLFYRAGAWEQGPVEHPWEIAETGFFPPDAPPEGATPATRRRLAEAFFGAPSTAIW